MTKTEKIASLIKHQASPTKEHSVSQFSQDIIEIGMSTINAKCMILDEVEE